MVVPFFRKRGRKTWNVSNFGWEQNVVHTYVAQTIKNYMQKDLAQKISKQVFIPNNLHFVIDTGKRWRT
jgi:hypothetical protein